MSEFNSRPVQFLVFGQLLPSLSVRVKVSGNAISIPNAATQSTNSHSQGTFTPVAATLQHILCDRTQKFISRSHHNLNTFPSRPNTSLYNLLLTYETLAFLWKVAPRYILTIRRIRSIKKSNLMRTNERRDLCQLDQHHIQIDAPRGSSEFAIKIINNVLINPVFVYIS